MRFWHMRDGDRRRSDGRRPGPFASERLEEPIAGHRHIVVRVMNWDASAPDLQQNYAASRCHSASAADRFSLNMCRG